MKVDSVRMPEYLQFTDNFEVNIPPSLSAQYMLCHGPSWFAVGHLFRRRLDVCNEPFYGWCTVLLGECTAA